MGLAGAGSKSALPPKFPTKAEKAKVAEGFSTWQHAGKDKSKKVSGAALKNEVGESLGVRPNRTPVTKAEKAEESAGRWVSYQGEELKPVERVSDAITREAGKPEAEIASIPVSVLPHGEKDAQHFAVFRVETPKGQRYVDSNARVYESFEAWQKENLLPEGVMTFPKEGKLTAPDGKSLNELVSAHTPLVPDTLREGLANMAQTAGIMGGTIIGGPAIAGATGVGMIASGVALTAQGIATPTLDLKDAYQHGEIQKASDVWENPRLRGDAFGLVASSVGAATLAAAAPAVGSAVKTGVLGSKVAPLAPGLNVAAGEVGAGVSKMSPFLNGPALATGGAALANQTVTCATSDDCSVGDLMLSVGQVGMFGAGFRTQAKSMTGAPTTAKGTIDGVINALSPKANARALKPMDADFTVGGAGPAGLAAAKKAHDAGLKVSVLEPQGRVGGRLHDWKPWGEDGPTIAEGGEWHTEFQDNPLTPEVKATGIELKETDYNQPTAIGSKWMTKAQVAEREQSKATLAKIFADAQEAGAKGSIADFLPKEKLPYQEAIIEDLVSNYGTSVDNISIQDAAIGNVGDKTPKGGLSGIVMKLVDGFPLELVKLKQEIVKVKINPGEDIEWHMRDGNVYYSKYGVVTAPPNVMKKGGIKIESPGHEGWTKAFNASEQADALKVFLHLDTKQMLAKRSGAWWQGINPKDGKATNFYVNPYAKDVLGVFFSGPEARQLSQLPKQERANYALARARTEFPNIDEHLIETHTSDWLRNKFAGNGAWSQGGKVGTPEKVMAALRKPLYNMLGYAGDGNPRPRDVDFTGTYNAAMESGRWQAGKGVRALGNWVDDPTLAPRLTREELVPRALRPGLLNASVSNGVTILPVEEPGELGPDDLDASSKEPDDPDVVNWK